MDDQGVRLARESAGLYALNNDTLTGTGQWWQDMLALE
jgi:hypothetical protein